jgi:hypothetical protein
MHVHAFAPCPRRHQSSHARTAIDENSRAFHDIPPYFSDTTASNYRSHHDLYEYGKNVDLRYYFYSKLPSLRQRDLGVKAPIKQA